MKPGLKIFISIICIIAVMASSFTAGAFVNRTVQNRRTSKQSIKTENLNEEPLAGKYDIYESYKEILSNNNMCDYTLLNLDSDDIPELITSCPGESYSSIILDVYSFTESDGAFAIGEITDCNDDTLLCAVEGDNCFYTNNLYNNYNNEDETTSRYYQKIEKYYKSEISLESEICLEESFDEWCQKLEDNYFVSEFQSIRFNNTEASHYYDLLSDVINEQYYCLSSDYHVNIYNINKFKFDNNDYGEYLKVTREDLYNLGTGSENNNSFLNHMLGYFHYNCPINSNYCENGSIEDLIRRIIGEGAYGETYKYYFGDLKAVKYTDKHDPLNRFSQWSGSDFGPTGEYYVIPAENIRWIMTNIFNITEWVDSYSIEANDFNCYLLDDMFYVEGIGFDGGDYTWYRIDSITDNENGTYDIYCVDDNTSSAMCSMKVALKNINGKRQWTILELEG